MVLELGDGVGTVSVRAILEVGVLAISVVTIVGTKTVDLVEQYFFVISVVIGVILVTTYNKYK